MHTIAIGKPLSRTSSKSSVRRFVGNDPGGMQQLVLRKSFGRLGLTLANNKHGPGVVVAGMRGDSAAAAHGLNVGDTIISINGHEATDHESAVELIDSPGDLVSLILAGERRAAAAAERRS